MIIKAKQISSQLVNDQAEKLSLEDNDFILIADSGNSLDTRKAKKSNITFYTVNQLKRTITLRAKADSGILPTGALKINLPIAINATITGWRLVCDVASTLSLDVWKKAGVLPSIADTIVAATPPIVTAASVASSSTLTGWTTAIAAGDIVECSVLSNNNANEFTLVLEMAVS